jgi:hypothetical protein
MIFSFWNLKAQSLRAYVLDFFSCTLLVHIVMDRPMPWAFSKASKWGIFGLCRQPIWTAAFEAENPSRSWLHGVTEQSEQSRLGSRATEKMRGICMAMALDRLTGWQDWLVKLDFGSALLYRDCRHVRAQLRHLYLGMKLLTMTNDGIGVRSVGLGIPLSDGMMRHAVRRLPSALLTLFCPVTCGWGR